MILHFYFFTDILMIFIAQNSLRSCFSLPETDLACSDCSENAKCGDPIKDHSSDLDLLDLMIKIREPHNADQTIS